jgi:hypothetical protein
MLTHAAQSISEWLTSLGMQQYVGAFADNAIDANALDALDHELLKEIVVTKFGHRIALLKAVAGFGTPNEHSIAITYTPSPPPTAVAERRQMTVMFCDLACSIALGEGLDADGLAQAAASSVKRVNRPAKPIPDGRSGQTVQAALSHAA